MGFKAIATLAVIGMFAVKPFIHYATMDTVTGVVVTDKERITSGGNSKFLIWTETETFENTDSLLAWKWRSSDIQGRMKVGATCDFEVNGFRIGFLSSYRNILSASCV